MPTTELVTKGKIIENSAVILTSRLINANTGSPIVPANVSSINLEVWDTTSADGTEVGTAVDLDPADVILPSLNTGYLSDDPTGYNLRIDLSGDNFPDGGKVYRVEVKVTPTTGDPWYRLWELTTLNVYSE